MAADHASDTDAHRRRFAPWWLPGILVESAKFKPLNG